MRWEIARKISKEGWSFLNTQYLTIIQGMPDSGLTALRPITKRVHGYFGGIRALLWVFCRELHILQKGIVYLLSIKHLTALILLVVQRPWT